MWVVQAAPAAIAAATLLAALGTSGCFDNCHESAREFTWTQDLPVNRSYVVYEAFPIYASAQLFPGEGNQTMIVATVTGTDMKISHEQAVGALQAMFAKHNWGQAQLDTATEKYDSCTTSY